MMRVGCWRRSLYPWSPWVLLSLVSTVISRRFGAVSSGKQGAQFVDLALIGVDDQLIPVSADLAVLADEILRHGNISALVR
jgi:hypothetical protein